MSKPANYQYGQLHAAVKMLKITDEDKKIMVASYTGDDAKTSFADMDFAQCSDLITKLKAQVDKINDPDAEAKQTIRRKIIAIAHQMAWYKTDADGKYILGKKFDKGAWIMAPQIDYPAIDAWLIKHTAAKKPLNKMDKTELQKAAFQFNKMYTNYTTKPKK